MELHSTKLHATVASFGERLQKAIDECGHSRAKVARIADVSEATLRRWVNRDDCPDLSRSDSEENFEAIVQTLGVRREWLLEGKGEMYPESESGVDNLSDNDNIMLPSSQIGNDDLTSLFQDDVQLDVYTEISVEGGDGRVVYPDEAKQKITVPRQFIIKIIGFVPPRQVGMMMVDGDSMHPTIQEDDMVLWRPVEEIRGGGVYVLSLDGGLVVKRVHKIPGGGLELISDNDYHGYPDYTLVPEGDTLINQDTNRSVEVHPVGKVIFPRRDTDRMHVKQVAEIVKSVAGGEVNGKS